MQRAADELARVTGNKEPGKAELLKIKEREADLDNPLGFPLVTLTPTP